MKTKILTFLNKKSSITNMRLIALVFIAIACGMGMGIVIESRIVIHQIKESSVYVENINDEEKEMIEIRLSKIYSIYKEDEHKTESISKKFDSFLDENFKNEKQKIIQNCEKLYKTHIEEYQYFYETSIEILNKELEEKKVSSIEFKEKVSLLWDYYQHNKTKIDEIFTEEQVKILYKQKGVLRELLKEEELETV